MRVVDRVDLVPAGGHVAEGTRVDDLAAAEGRLEHVAVALAVRHAPSADARAGHVSRSVSGLQRLVRARVREIHARSPCTAFWRLPNSVARCPGCTQNGTAVIRTRPRRIGRPVWGSAERGRDEAGPAHQAGPARKTSARGRLKHRLHHGAHVLGLGIHGDVAAGGKDEAVRAHLAQEALAVVGDVLEASPG